VKYFLDTNTCIYYLKGKSPRVRSQLLSKRPEEIKVPSIVKAELLYGAAKSQQQDKNVETVKTFLLPYEIVAFGSQEAVAYAEIRAALERAGQIIGPNDLIVAATARAAGGILITNNTGEFQRVDQLRVANWVERENASP